MINNCTYRFESDDVTLGLDGPNFLLRQKIVAYSLLDVGRYAGRKGFRPIPQLVTFATFVHPTIHFVHIQRDFNFIVEYFGYLD